MCVCVCVCIRLLDFKTEFCVFFYVLLTVHLSTVLAISQLNAQILVLLLS